MLFNTRTPLGALALVPLASAAVIDLPIEFRNSYAMVEVEVGTPPVNHFLLFDTGSATTWMVDSKCADTCNNYSGYSRTGYDVNASSTARSLGTYDSIEYLGGVTAGAGLEDSFKLGETRWNQTFMAANESSWSWTPGDGFLGLAFSTITDAGTKTMVETMIQEGVLDQPRFSLYYGKEFNDTKGVPGEGVLTFGGSEEEKYVDGELVWVPVQIIGSEYQLWRSTMRGLTGTVGGKQTETKAYNSWVVFDTGAGGMSVPPGDVESIYASIGMNWTAIRTGEHLPLCSEFNSTWSVTFTIGESDADAQNVTLTGDQLARPGFAYREDACYPPFDDSGIAGFYLFGPSMLHQVYSVFDFGSEYVSGYMPRIGFGQLKPEYKP
ncbi:pepsinogen c [Biscogniauxia mediterranea]|nr:pepsinogen c [Biscogniauxia mediterranea]